MALLIYLAIFVCVGLSYKALGRLEKIVGKPVVWARTAWYAIAGAAIASVIFPVL